MCPNSNRKTDTIEVMSQKLFLKIISEIVEENISHTLIHFYLQNEPFMDHDILNKIRLTKELSNNKIHIELVTNGTFLNENIIQELQDIDIDILVISLDAYTQKTYEKIRGGLDFSSVLKNIENLISQECSSKRYVGFVEQKENSSELQEFKKYWRRIGHKVKNKIYPYITVLNNRSGDLYDFYRLTKQNNTIEVKRNIFKFIHKIFPGCYVPFLDFNILSNGDVILCCNDYNKKVILGNVASSSIKEIWNSSEYDDIRRLIANRRYQLITGCNNCSLIL